MLAGGTQAAWPRAPPERGWGHTKRQKVLLGHIPALLTPLPQAEGMPETVNGSLTMHVLNVAIGLPAASLAQLQEPGPQWMELGQR